MVIYDVYWTNRINILKVKCDCGNKFEWPTNISMIYCHFCENKEWWHSDGEDYPDFPNLKKAKMRLK